MVLPPRIARRASHRSVGQALVETALLLPILLILLVAAIDLGRAFFGWVNLHQAARVAANYAATHPLDDYTDADLAYFDLVDGETGAINCELVMDGGGLLPAPTFSANPAELGDSATVTLECGFELITPIAAQIVGQPLNMVATSTFTVRQGCIDCPPPPSMEPPPEPDDMCRFPPALAGMSLDGARNAWLSAGFLPENLTAFPAGTPGTATVDDDPAPVLTDDSGVVCDDPGWYYFSTSVDVWLIEPDPVTAGCSTVPNLIGLRIEDARTEWADAGFDPAGFDPPLPDDDPDSAVIGQTTSPSSQPGVTCAAPTTTITVEIGQPWETPPPAPCIVPRFVDEVRKNDAQAVWTQAHFTTTVIFEGASNGNWTIRGQSLVVDEAYNCSVTISLYQVEPEP
jgi:hypothetical protein